MKIRTRLFQIFGILLGVLFVLACLVGFAACGDSDESSEENKGVQTGDGDGDDDGDSGSTGGNEGEHTHSYTSSVTKEATCGEVGETTYTCSCGDTYTETIPATGAHEVDVAGWTVTTPASCGEDGVRTNTCILCKHTVTEAIPATGEHVVVGSGDDDEEDDGWTVTTEATCGTDGERTGTCSVCQKIVTEVIPATGEHTYGEATLGTDGVYTKTCETCGDVQTVDLSTESTNEGTTYAVLRAEAENAVIDVDETMMNYWLNNDVFQGSFVTGFLFGVQDDTTASGGQSVGYLAHNNPTLTFTVNSDVDISDATITIHAASCDVDTTGITSVFGLAGTGINQYDGSSHDILLVNPKYNALTGALSSGKVALSGTLSGADSVYKDFLTGELNMSNWGTLTATGVALGAGDNTITLTHDGAGLNIDYIEISVPETNSGEVSLSFVETDNSDLVSYDSAWVAYDEATLEAENAWLTDAAGSTTPMEVVEYVQTGDVVVENITKGDDLIFQIATDSAISDATVTINVTSDGDLSADDFTIALNEYTDAVGDNIVTDAKISRGAFVFTVDLVAGVNYIELTSASDSTIQLDNIVVEWDYDDADGRGSYVVTTAEEIPTVGTTWNTANATAAEGGGYTLTLEAEDGGLFNAVGKVGSLVSGLMKEETQSGRKGKASSEDEGYTLTFEDGASVGNFNTEGDTIVLVVYAEEAIEDVAVTITAGSAFFSSGITLGDYDASSHSILTVNGEGVEMSGTLYGGGVLQYSSSWGYITATISLQEGVNYIVFTCDGTGVNLDNVVLTWGASVAG